MMILVVAKSKPLYAMYRGRYFKGTQTQHVTRAADLLGWEGDKAVIAYLDWVEETPAIRAYAKNNKIKELDV